MRNKGIKAGAKWGMIKLETYEIDVIFSYGEEPTDLYDRLLSYKVAEEEDLDNIILGENSSCLGLCVMFNGGQCLIVINPKGHKTKHELYGTIAHECFHCAHEVMVKVGMGKLKLNINDEAYAYLIGHLVRECHNIID